MDFFRFIFSIKFLKHLGLAAILLAILTWLVLLLLSFYTNHGKYLTVPQLTGRTIDQVSHDPACGDFHFLVIDSVFRIDQPKGMILSQDPYPESHVKKNRTIYLTIVSFNPDKTIMPDLRFLTFRQAISILESLGLKTGRITYIRTFDENAVQQQYYSGEVIEPGTKIDKGSYIDLVVGSRSGGGSHMIESDSLYNEQDSL